MDEPIAAVVPVIDEAEAIGGVVRGLLAAGACCVIAVDSGSRDRTREIAALEGARIIEEPCGGYGRACLTGAEIARGDHGHGAIAFLDGDGSCDPADLPRLCTGLRTADLVLGRRRPRDIVPGAMPIHARLGNALVAGLITLRTGRRVHDLPPYKLIRSEALHVLDLDATGYGWTTQLVARAAARGSVRIREVPVRFLRRRGGVSKVGGRAGASVHAAIAMLRTAWHETAPQPTIAIVAKAPRRGGVKTRLVPELGEGASASLWSASLADTAALVERAAAELHATCMVVARSHESTELEIRFGSRWKVVEQRLPGLDGAIIAAFVAAAAAGSDRALVVSGDNPDLPPEHLASAFRELHSRRAVLGPTLDGGYHLIGLRWWRIPRLPIIGPILRRMLSRRLRAVFAPVAMGSGAALDGTRRSLAVKGWDAVDSPPWPDLDTAEDLHDLGERVRNAAPDVAPRTRAWLAARTAERQRDSVAPEVR